ncbi:spinocerebellar ataxia type 10 protein domain-containing protein [Gongronella butleri]|nr:spinocerebellar ataxia type 10 protein domain-containing protein [Gongronella butleri]
MSRVIFALESLARGSGASEQTSELLVEAVQESTQDQEFRIDLGQQPKLWSAAHQLLSASTCVDQAWVVPLIKLLRNATAANAQGQALACEAGVIDDLVGLVRFCGNSLDQHRLLMVRLCTQAVCNMVTGNDVVLDKMWNVWCEREETAVWNRVIEANDKDSVTGGLILVYQCIRNSSARCASLVKTTHGLTMLKSVLYEIDRSHAEETNQHFELGYLIMHEILTNGFFVDVIYRLSTGDAINEKQMVVIKMLDSSLHKDNAPVLPWTAREMDTLSTLLLNECNQAHTIIDNVLAAAQQQHDKPTGSLDDDQVSLTYICLVLLLQIMNWLMMHGDTTRPAAKKSWLAHQGMQKTIELLRQCDRLAEWKEKEQLKNGFAFVKRELVRLLGNLCYQDKACQDDIRELGGLGLILNQMQIDDTNPYIREYATLALRHVLENNTANQQWIEQLKPMGTSQPEELTRMGLQSSIVDGKIQWNKFK